LPFAIALAIDIYISVEPVTGEAMATIISSGIFIAAIFFWYLLEAIRIRHDANRARAEEGETPMAKRDHATTSTEQKIQHALTEARVVLPGAQALLGFQFVAVLLGGFETLPSSSKYVHVASLTLVTFSTILLMTPAAYHRLVERGEATEHFFRLASAMVLWSLVPLSCGTCGDFFVLARKISGSIILASTATVAILLCFYGLWFGFSLYRKASRGALSN
jgi:cbb3-type cytochrome oxidase subunit 3